MDNVRRPRANVRVGADLGFNTLPERGHDSRVQLMELRRGCVATPSSNPSPDPKEKHDRVDKKTITALRPLSRRRGAAEYFAFASQFLPLSVGVRILFVRPDHRLLRVRN